MQDSETGELIWVDTSSAEVRKQYHRNYLQRVAGFEANFARCGADTIAIATNQPYMPALHGFFRKRMQRR